MGGRRAATLPVRFFARPANVVARELLGAIVESRAGGHVTAGRIVETEAYLGFDDPAAHGYLGRRNAQNESIFGPPGSWYVYLSYGVHWCANLVCAREGEAAAVLLRALEPTAGIDIMRKRRGRRARPTTVCRARATLPGSGNYPRDRRDLDAELRGQGDRRRGVSRGHGGRDAEDRHHQSRRLATALRGARLAASLPPLTDHLTAGCHEKGPARFRRAPFSLMSDR